MVSLCGLAAQKYTATSSLARFSTSKVPFCLLASPFKTVLFLNADSENGELPVRYPKSVTFLSEVCLYQRIRLKFVLL